MWWHHVQGLSPFNTLVNYWWTTLPAYIPTPMNTLYHAIWTLRDRPENEKRAWKQVFDYYVFGPAGLAGEHFPEQARGVLGPDHRRSGALHSRDADKQIKSLKPARDAAVSRRVGQTESILETREVKRVVIAGGGTAGWLAAAALSHQLGKVLDITLIESDEIGTIGVGEATIPPIRVFHKLLQIDEQEFMRATAATFKLGISFENWGLKGDRYIHSFGRNGKPTWMCEFHNFWLRSLELGVQSELGEYCFELQAAKADKFATSQQLEINFAYHFDAGQYAKFLRRFAEGFGIKRVEGKIKEVKQNANHRIHRIAGPALRADRSKATCSSIAPDFAV